MMKKRLTMRAPRLRFAPRGELRGPGKERRDDVASR